MGFIILELIDRKLNVIEKRKIDKDTDLYKII